MSYECMIDIETLSTEPKACILTIGAIKFKRYDEIKPLKDMNTFYVRINIDSCLKAGLHQDEKTLQWWNTQNEDVRYEALENPDRISLRDALKQLSNFLFDCKFLWSQGSFDPTILQEAYKAVRIPVPWKFWYIRDCRTLFDISSVDLKSITVEETEMKHNALYDCYIQLKAMDIALKKLI